MSDNTNPGEMISLTADVVSAYVSNNVIPASELPNVINSIHNSLLSLSNPQASKPEPETLTPAVSVKKSVNPDYIICLEDGKKFKSLKRHLRTKYDMTPDQYRAKWGLPADYPMVAPNYAAARSELAKAMGLGAQRRKDKEAA